MVRRDENETALAFLSIMKPTPPSLILKHHPGNCDLVIGFWRRLDQVSIGGLVLIKLLLLRLFAFCRDWRKVVFWREGAKNDGKEYFGIHIRFKNYNSNTAYRP